MNQQEESHIQQHLHKLIQFTRCTATLLGILVSLNCISLEELSEIVSIRNDYHKSLTLYRILITRNNAYHNLHKALQETKQTGSVKILEMLRSKHLTNQVFLQAVNRNEMFFEMQSGEGNLDNQKLTREVKSMQELKFTIRLKTVRSQSGKYIKIKASIALSTQFIWSSFIFSGCIVVCVLAYGA